jgi:uncharacterized MAPEG superfamily protein
MTTPLLCIFVAYLLVFFPKIVVAVAQAKQPGGYDNQHPRDQQARLEGWGKRAVAAHMNAFEALAPFAAAVLVALVGHADLGVVTPLAIAFLVIRVAYTLIYIGGMGMLRSAVWTLGFLATCALFLSPVIWPAR